MSATKVKAKETTAITNVNSFTLNELEPYITGKKFLDAKYKKPKVTKEMFQEFWDRLCMDDTYKTLVECFEYHKDFFTACPDLAKMYEEDLHQELFYAAKVGYIYEGVPTYLVYMIKQCLKQYPFGNLIIKMIPLPYLNQYLKEEALGDHSLYDVISQELEAEYSVVTNHHLVSEYQSADELYVQKEDMVALLPKGLIQETTQDYLESLELFEEGLASPDGIYLGSFGGYHNACNSFYDLRNLL